MIKVEKQIKQYEFNGKQYVLQSNHTDFETCLPCAFNSDTKGCDSASDTCCNISGGYFKEVKETTQISQDNQGIKFDDGKIQWWYLPIEPIKEVLKVLHYGDKKYPADDGCNWKRVPNAKKRYYSALMRHITAWWDGEKNDQESGMHHLAHACTNVLFLLYFEMRGYPEDKKN